MTAAAAKGRPRDPLALPSVRGKPLRLAERLPELSSNPSTDRRWLRGVPRPWAVDLFSGAGGLSLGLQEAGLNVIAAADSDAVALRRTALGMSAASHAS